MASWDDWAGAALTGGLYNVGKALYKTSEAADQAGDAADKFADDAGKALAIVGETIRELGDKLTSLIEDINELIIIERVTPREEDDLSEGEKERLEELRVRETQLLKELKELGGIMDVGRPSSWVGKLLESNQPESIPKMTPKMTQRMRLIAELNVVRKAIRKLLYEEPGVIPRILDSSGECQFFCAFDVERDVG